MVADGSDLASNAKTDAIDLQQRLAQFLADRKVIAARSSAGARLNRFLEAARGRLGRPWHDKTLARPVDSERLKATLSALREPMRLVQDRACANPWTVAGLGTDEVRISAALASLWNRHLHGDAAVDFLCGFFAEIDKREMLPGRPELMKGYHVQKEHCPNGAIGDRVDITIEGTDFIIGIEVKIEAGLGKQQLERYCQTIAKRSQLMFRKKHVVIFLAPFPSGLQSVLDADWSAITKAATNVDGRSGAPPLIRMFGRFCSSFGKAR
jgi:hypothetical protein